jgi:hypothetical protein
VAADEAIVEDRGEKAKRGVSMTTAITDQNPPRNRSRSERKQTAKMLSAICELVKNGLSVSHAAEKLHIHHSTAARWRKELPEFDAAILAAEAEFIDSQVANIRTAAKTSWQAAAWLLERKFPAFFSQPQVQFNMPGARAEFEDDFGELLERVRSTSAFKQIMAQESVIDVPALPAS